MKHVLMVLLAVSFTQAASAGWFSKLKSALKPAYKSTTLTENSDMVAKIKNDNWTVVAVQSGKNFGPGILDVCYDAESNAFHSDKMVSYCKKYGYEYETEKGTTKKFKVCMAHGKRPASPVSAMMAGKMKCKLAPGSENPLWENDSDKHGNFWSKCVPGKKVQVGRTHVIEIYKLSDNFGDRVYFNPSVHEDYISGGSYTLANYTIPNCGGK